MPKKSSPMHLALRPNQSIETDRLRRPLISNVEAVEKV
jgi:hypothetical protein